MNKQWIKSSHYHAGHHRTTFLSNSKEHSRYPIYEYLDAIGLFETGWMVYDFDKYKNERNKYGYPK